MRIRTMTASCVVMGLVFSTSAWVQDYERQPADRGGESTIYVDDDNCPGPGSGTAVDPFCKIQAGIDAAFDDDTVLVADGTYTGEGNKNMSFDGKAITVQSENGPESTIIDMEGDGRAFTFENDEGPDSVLDGSTLTNGNVDDDPWPESNGGAIWCYLSSPTIADCTFSGNSAREDGGGMCNKYSDPTLTNCTFSGNSADYGGGMYNDSYSSPILTNCTFSANTTLHHGGGM